MKRLFYFAVFLGFFTATVIAEECKIHLVLGSDTAIWNGMSTTRYHNTYDPALYTDPNMNGHLVMSDAYRSRLVDSYGTPMKLTWWMMCGNIFRYATNTDCPIPNIMTMYHMQENHLPQIEKWGDELTLHYHTFFWSDYDKDGRWYWNQSYSFEESREDFDFTLCQLLLEEENFFVSFRSGWHFMDNDWQAYLDELMPFSMHNDYPVHGIDNEEPLDNNYDWSQATDLWEPFHPSPENYQLPGNSGSWNLRSQHIGNVRYRATLDTIFARASRGIPQVACLWGHLPETDFCQNLEIIDSIAHQKESEYGVTFKYSTAIEAMQEWLKTNDLTAPQMTLTESGPDHAFYVDIHVDEPIFQKYPYVAVKDVYENYYKMECISGGNLTWRTIAPLDKSKIAKIGVAVCDSVGNQTLDFLCYLPDDRFLDDGDENFQVITGNGKVTNSSSWGKTATYIALNSPDTAAVVYDLNIEQSGWYNLFYQIPGISGQAANYIFQILADGVLLKETRFEDKLPEKSWVYLATLELSELQSNQLYIKVPAAGQTSKIALFDVLKVSPLVREYDLISDFNSMEFGKVSVNIENFKSLTLKNSGYKNLKISDMYFQKGLFYLPDPPSEIPAMGEATVEVSFYSNVFGEFLDTLIIESSDQLEPVKKICFSANVTTYFLALDNEDSLHYHEVGTWNTSVTQAYGLSSRFSSLNQNPRAYATFAKQLDYQGLYDIEFIVPVTVNSTNHALYIVYINNVVIDSIIIDQNEGSGDWVTLGRYFLPSAYEIKVKVQDTGKNSNPQGVVLRADALQFTLVENLTELGEDVTLPYTFELKQNHPNPFNGSTTIQYAVPSMGKVHLAVYNLIGQEVDVLVNEMKAAGFYELNWSSSELSTGVYIYRLRFNNQSVTKRLILMK
ncbi:MAG: T9SS type A sorting domain-containing protein [Candidatus Marinimicrobia bacterium]|nr:T9SS type A sorting domain-containing protein [Candidatus Neomarinimicrobiota bacterium]